MKTLVLLNYKMIFLNVNIYKYLENSAVWINLLWERKSGRETSIFSSLFLVFTPWWRPVLLLFFPHRKLVNSSIRGASKCKGKLDSNLLLKDSSLGGEIRQHPSSPKGGHHWGIDKILSEGEWGFFSLEQLDKCWWGGSLSWFWKGNEVWAQGARRRHGRAEGEGMSRVCRAGVCFVLWGESQKLGLIKKGLWEPWVTQS